MKINAVALGARAMKWRYWQWQPRMVAVPNKGSDFEGWCTILDVRPRNGAVCAWTDCDGEILTDTNGAFHRFADLVPDFTDAATVGAFYAYCRSLVKSGKVCVSTEEERDIDIAFQLFGVGIELAEALVDLMEHE